MLHVHYHEMRVNYNTNFVFGDVLFVVIYIIAVDLDKISVIGILSFVFSNALFVASSI